MSNISKSHSLQGQFALVTGASGGIGEACALGLAAAGVNIGIHYRSNKRAAEKLMEKCEALGVESQIFEADVANPKMVVDMFNKFISRFGYLDILLANAGVQADNPITDMSFDDWNKVIGVNLSGQFYCAQQAAKIFLRQGVREGVSNAAGKIVHMSSVHQKIPWPGHCNYAASKGGVKLLMESIALELAPQKIRVNAIAPGAIKTEINQNIWSDDEKRKKLLKIIPNGRMGETQEIAKAVSYLCSDDSDYVTGTTLYIDGGMSLYPSFIDNG